MDFLVMVKDIFILYFQEHIYIGIAIGALFLFLFIRKPRVFFAIFFITVFLTGVLYLISTLTSTGAYHKKKILQKEEQLYKDYMR